MSEEQKNLGLDLNRAIVSDVMLRGSDAHQLVARRLRTYYLQTEKLREELAQQAEMVDYLEVGNRYLMLYFWATVVLGCVNVAILFVAGLLGIPAVLAGVIIFWPY